MVTSRREFLNIGRKAGLVASTGLLWSTQASALQTSLASGNDYKAIVVITLNGGNDGNNTVVPLDPVQYAAYRSIRPSLAVSNAYLLPLNHTGSSPAYGLHPSLKTVAALYNSEKALIAANIGPIVRPSTKDFINKNSSLYPGGSLSHATALMQWETAQDPVTGWGGRLADNLTSASGSLPPVLTTAQSWFNVGNTVQAVAVQGGATFAALPPGLTDAIARISQSELSSSNLLTAVTAGLRSRAMASQQILNTAASYDQLKTVFGNSQLHQGLKSIAQLIAGRSVIGASRQIFYTEQFGYDNHQDQYRLQAEALADLDSALAAFLAALDEIGMRDSVLVCTHSDFCRSLQPNTTGGTDHAWGNHHFVIGGGIRGGRIVGTMPDMELNGALDTNGTGIWIPTQSVTQMTAGMSSWFGLSSRQINAMFPDLQNFPAGQIALT